VTLLVLAFVVDTAILFVFYRVKELRNVTNNLLCNMVTADLLFDCSVYFGSATGLLQLNYHVER